MQPTPSHRTREPVARAVQQNSYPPGLSKVGRLVAPGVAEASDLFAADQSPDEEDGATGTLDDVARREREDMRPRLRDELGREPTEEELDEWLRRHTEGY
jgi:hypothetical protein